MSIEECRRNVENTNLALDHHSNSYRQDLSRDMSENLRRNSCVISKYLSQDIYQTERENRTFIMEKALDATLTK